ncbi:unnamed protein product [Merluccius merluccius]
MKATSNLKMSSIESSDSMADHTIQRYFRPRPTQPYLHFLPCCASCIFDDVASKGDDKLVVIYDSSASGVSFRSTHSHTSTSNSTPVATRRRFADLFGEIDGVAVPIKNLPMPLPNQMTCRGTILDPFPRLSLQARQEEGLHLHHCTSSPWPPPP